VKDSEESDLRAEVLWICRNGSQCLGGGTEEDAKDQLFILVGDGRDRLWHGKDDMKIADLQKFGLSVLDPLRPCERLTFWAVPVPAAIEAIAFMATLIATLEVAAECGCAAHLNGGHDAPLCLRHRRAMLISINFPVAAKHVRYFPLWPIHRSGA
jgi:hypothetical protein